MPMGDLNLATTFLAIMMKLKINGIHLSKELSLKNVV